LSSGPGVRVLDSWGLMAFLEDEPAAERMEEIIASAQEEGELLVTSVNLAEVWYSTARSRSEAEADAAVARLVMLGIKVVDADWRLAREAARLKAKRKIALGDSFAAALANLRGAEVVTGDPEFKQLEDEVRVLWV